MIEYDGMNFRTHQEKDKFLEERELRRKANQSEFERVNEFNHFQANSTSVGVWATAGDGPTGSARFFIFSDPEFFNKIQHSALFRESYPSWKWDLDGERPKMKTMSAEDWQANVERLQRAIA